MRLALSLLALLAPAAAAQRVLVVDLDDLGYDLLESTPTPVLDRIAREGRAFTNLYSCPVCSPSRARMNLGLYGMRPASLVAKTVEQDGEFAMPVAPHTTLAQVVSDAERRTAKVGKWHLAPTADVEHVRRAGWQRYVGLQANTRTAGDTYFEWDQVEDGQTTHVTGRYLTSAETDLALAFVREGVELVSVSYHAIHAPFHVPPRELYTGPEPDYDVGRARAMLQALDHELGRLLDEALAGDYTVLVLSDNGSPQPVGGFKTTLWEGGIRVPCFAIGRGVAPGVDPSLVDWVDVYATALELLGVAVPAGRAADSVSFAPALAGAPGARRWNYSERWPTNGLDPRAPGNETYWRRAARGPRYKLLRNQDGLGDKLFDLERDPAEQTNLLLGELGEEQATAYRHLREVLERL
jgi:arylsulfatase A-like enzyme